MATALKVEIPTGDHTPVSNESEDSAFVAVDQPILQAPSEGERREAGEAAMGDVEAVAGAGGPRAMSADMWVAPDMEGLRDIGEASFGRADLVAETVLGPDDRVRITNTSSMPWRMNASLLITAADNSTWIGTAWFIGPHTLMTAGHCVYIKNSGVPGRDGWVKRIQVMPGRNGSTLPYGSVTSTSFRSVTAWTQNGNPDRDYGAIIIPTQLGNTVGWYGFGVYPDADLLAATGNIAGYPGDKPSGTLWYDSRKIASVNSLKVFYTIDTAGGQSGSAVYRIVNGARYGVAIHAYGGSVTNSGTRINSAVYNNMVAWKA